MKTLISAPLEFISLATMVAGGFALGAIPFAVLLSTTLPNGTTPRGRGLYMLAVLPFAGAAIGFKMWRKMVIPMIRSYNPQSDGSFTSTEVLIKKYHESERLNKRVGGSGLLALLLFGTLAVVFTTVYFFSR